MTEDEHKDVARKFMDGLREREIMQSLHYVSTDEAERERLSRQIGFSAGVLSVWANMLAEHVA